MPVYFANTGPISCQCWYRYWASTGPIHCASTGPVLNHYYLSTGPIQLAGTGPVLGQYIAPALAQCWTSIGPTLGQYHMPALARFTAAVQRMHWANAVYTCLPVLVQYWPNTLRQHWPNAGQHWPNTGAVPHASICPIHSRCAVYALGQCRLYRPASIGPVLAQYCHVCWAISSSRAESRHIS